MDATYSQLWVLPNSDTTQQVRIRMYFDDKIVDETMTVKLSLTNTLDQDIDAAAQARIAEIEAGTINPGDSKIVEAESAEQIIEEK